MKNIVNIILLFFCNMVSPQTIQGSFPQAKNTEIILKGFEGFSEKELAKTTTDSIGKFTLSYPASYVGAALLQIKGSSSVIVLLNQENFAMQWENLPDFNTLQFTTSSENDAFSKGITLNQESEQKLAGLKYLIPLYKNQTEKTKWLQGEIKSQELTFENYINSLPDKNYAKDYLKLRKFMGDMQLTHDRYKEMERVGQHEKEFKKIDFASKALWNSGLTKEILNSYYQLLDNYQDEKLILEHCVEANTVWQKSLQKEPVKLQEFAEFCFNQLEKKGLTKASEQIALAMLNKNNCQLTDKQTNLFEQYRKLAIGKTAPNLFNLKDKTNLKDLKAKYKLVVFGASWCPNCQNDYPSLIGKYKKLKETYNLEVVYISIDTDKTAFEKFYKDAPFITFCDARGWETHAAKDYHVFATPTYILLDKDLKIIAKPRNPEELQQWLQETS